MDALVFIRQWNKKEMFMLAYTNVFDKLISVWAREKVEVTYNWMYSVLHKNSWYVLRFVVFCSD